MKSKDEEFWTSLKINELARRIHDNAVSHGWWENHRPLPEIIALCHSELSEALEEYRKWGEEKIPYIYKSFQTTSNDEEEKRKQEKTAKPEGVVIELIDCLIRILDYLTYVNIDIEKALHIKMEYNEQRPYRHGGKFC